MEEIITEDYLNANPNFIFVFGDNLKRVGCGGAAKLRHLPNTYGFITKKAPSNKDEDYYKPEEYHDIFMDEVDKLHEEIFNNPDKIYLISKLFTFYFQLFTFTNTSRIVMDLFSVSMYSRLGSLSAVMPHPT